MKMISLLVVLITPVTLGGCMIISEEREIVRQTERMELTQAPHITDGDAQNHSIARAHSSTR